MKDARDPVSRPEALVLVPINQVQENKMTATSHAHKQDSVSANRAVRAVNGVEYEYRDVGEGTPPLVLLQHFRGNLDNWGSSPPT